MLSARKCIFVFPQVGQARSDRHREAYEQEIEHLKLFSQERDPLVVRLYDSEIVGEFGSKVRSFWNLVTPTTSSQLHDQHKLSSLLTRMYCPHPN